MEINSNDVEIKEFYDHGRGHLMIIATVRYAYAIRIDQEAIDDFGKGIVDDARHEAITKLIENPAAVPAGYEYEVHEYPALEPRS